MSGYILYYDSGTSNTRAYLLDRDFQVQYTAKTAVGSKDSAISGSNAVLIQGMRALYDRVLSANGLKEEDITDHAMHSEYCVIPQETADLINRTKAAGGRVICVGTTSCRTTSPSSI